MPSWSASRNRPDAPGHWNEEAARWKGIPFSSAVSIRRFLKRFCTAGAYVITQSCAKKLLDFHTPRIRCRADEWEVYYENNIMPIVHCIYPMPITENYDHGSEINYTRNGIEALGKKLITWSIYNRIPILTYLFKKRRESYSNRHKNIELEN